jgi:hypothetical protein
MAEISFTKEDTKNPTVGNELLSHIASALPVLIGDEK